MIRYKKLPKNIIDLLPQAAEYLKARHDVEFAYLFGGLAAREPSPLSDVDIAVYLAEDTDVVESKLAILEKLADILHTEEIDLVVLNKSSLPICMNILKNHRILVDKKPVVRHSYQSIIMRKYFDYSRLEAGILKRRFYYG
jgi:predicted nucleotidyltransferase